MLAAKFFSSSHDEDQEAPWSVQTQQLLQEIDELGQILSPITICMNKNVLHTCATCVTFDGP